MLFVSIKKRIKDFYLNICFEIREGCLGILGQSGCGKSMTLKCIAGIEKPDEGHILLNGRVLFDSGKKINVKPQLRNVGYLFQNYALFPNMTVCENIQSGIGKRLYKKQEASNKVQRMITLFHLQGMENSYPKQLSGGQQQRVALARILASEPELLLLDEPFSALDTYIKEELIEEAANTLKQYPGNALMVTHNRDEAYKLTSHLLVMHHGTALCMGPSRRLFEKPENVYAAHLTGCKNISRVRKLNEYQVFVLDWNIALHVAHPVTDAVTHIGIRAHDLLPSGHAQGVNTFPVRIASIVEEPFSWSLRINPGECSPGGNYTKDGEGAFPQLLWKISKKEGNPTNNRFFAPFITLPPSRMILLHD